MTTRTLLGLLVSTIAVAGCVMMPAAPMIAALPGSQKTYEQFQADDLACRANAEAATSGPGQAAANNAAANAAAATAVGAAAGAIIGSASGQAGQGAAIGAGAGLLFGSAAGSGYTGYTSYDLQRHYDAVYLQCMYAHGNRVPARYAYEVRPSGYAAPAYPPVNYPPPGSAGSSGSTPSYPPPSYPAPGYRTPSYPPPDTPPPRG